MNRTDRRVILVAAAILVASVLPLGSGTGGATSGALLGVGLDKWLHAVGFAVLAAALVGYLERRRSPRPGRPAATLARAVLLATLFGAGAELLQWPLPWRRASTADLAADAVGALVGAAAALLVRRRPGAGRAGLEES